MRGSIISVLLCCLVAASEAPRADRRRLAVYNYQEVAKLTASDATAYNWFGRSVAIAGDTVVVGAPYDDDAGTNSGSAYIFRTTDGGATYGQVAKLTASDAVMYDIFGISVAIAGDTVVIGAYNKNWGKGAVYVFRTSDGGAAYAQVARLTASDAAADDEFGISVAIDGDTIVVGAIQKDNGGAGMACVFSTTDGGASYSQVAKLTASDAATDDRFGQSVAIDGGTVVVGAYLDDDAGANSGSVYVSRTSDGGATYGQVAKLTASDGASSDLFGYSVAIDGGTVVVGAYGDDDGGSASGSAYVFRTSDGGATYDEVSKLTASDAAADDRFGFSVAIDGTTVVVGTWNGEAAYVFSTSDGGASYSQVAKLTASDADLFGVSVAIDGGTVVVGAYIDDDGGYNSGSAYVFDPNMPTSQPTTSEPTSLPTTSQPTTGAPTPQPTSQPTTAQPTSQPTPEPTQEQDLLAMILIPVAAAVFVLWCLYCVRSAKKKQPVPHARDGAASTDPTVPSAPPLPPLPPSTTTADPTKLREVHGRMVSWYEGQVALRQRWGPFPTRPELLEAWPGFIPVTNAFMDAEDRTECATPVAVQVTRPEVARPVAGTSTAPFATVVNVQRVVRGWSARGLQRLASWRAATPEEEV
jgi:hypothetical protein